MPRTTLSQRDFEYIIDNKGIPVSEILDNTKASIQDVERVLGLIGVEPVYDTRRLSPKEGIRGSRLSIAQSMEYTGRPYGFFYDAILAGELPFARPETMKDSYWLGKKDVDDLVKRATNGGIKKRPELRSERYRSEYNFPRTGKNGMSSDQKYFDYLLCVPLLDEEEQLELLRRVKHGDELAVDDIIDANLRMVRWKVKGNWRNAVQLSPMDLFQEGSLGLKRAVLKYDPDKINPYTGIPYKFSTYAQWWINQAITRAIADTEETIRIPVHVYDRRSKLCRFSIEFINEHGREPSIDEIAEKFPKWPKYGIEGDLKYLTWSPGRSVRSLDAPLGEDGDSTLADLIEDKEAENPRDFSEGSSALAEIESQLGTLYEREEVVLRLRFGIGVPRTTLEEVGQRLGVTRERIRQIEDKAIRKLRHPLRARRLRTFMDD